VTVSQRLRGCLTSLAALLVAGCLPDVTLPTCATDSDCPASTGLCRCRHGYCFRDDSCAVPAALPACASSSSESIGDLCCLVGSELVLDPDCNGFSADGRSAATTLVQRGGGPVVAFERRAAGDFLVWAALGGSVAQSLRLGDAGTTHPAGPALLSMGDIVVLAPSLLRVAPNAAQSPIMLATLSAAPAPLVVFPGDHVATIAPSGDLVVVNAAGIEARYTTPLVTVGSFATASVGLVGAGDRLAACDRSALHVLTGPRDDSPGDALGRLDAACEGDPLPVSWEGGLAMVVRLASGELMGLASSDGTSWSTLSGATLPASASGLLAFGSTVVALASDGETAWTWDLDGPEGPVGATSLGAGAGKRVVALDGDLLVVVPGASATRLSLAGGERWRFVAPGGARAEITSAAEPLRLDDGSALVTFGDGRLHRLRGTGATSGPPGWARSRGDSAGTGWVESGK